MARTQKTNRPNPSILCCSLSLALALASGCDGAPWPTGRESDGSLDIGILGDAGPADQVLDRDLAAGREERTPADLLPTTDGEAPGDMARRDTSPTSLCAAPLPAWSANPAKTIYVAAADTKDKSLATLLCDGTADQTEINQAIQQASTAGSAGGKVVLLEGHYSGNGIIGLKSHVTLEGAGAKATFLRLVGEGRIEVTAPYVVLRAFHVGGYQYPRRTDRAPIHATQGHLFVHCVTATADTTPQAVFYVQSSTNIEDIEFYGCVADKPGTYGFLHSSWPKHLLHKNLRYKHCQAIDCGRHERYKDWSAEWITGFNFGELNDIQDLLVEDCVAEGTWESGFHAEWEPKITNVTFRRCTSKYNGQKPLVANGLRTNENYFGCGFNFREATNIQFFDCTSIGDSATGFFVSYVHGGRFSGCKAIDTGAAHPGGHTTGFNDVRTPIAYYIVQTQNLRVENSSSTGSLGYGLYQYPGTNTNLQVVNFTDQGSKLKQ